MGKRKTSKRKYSKRKVSKKVSKRKVNKVSKKRKTKVSRRKKILKEHPDISLTGDNAPTIGTISTGKNGLAWQVIVNNENEKEWRVCSNPLIGSDYTMDKNTGMATPTKKGEKKLKKYGGVKDSIECDESKRLSIVSTPKTLRGHGLPTKKKDIRDLNLQKGTEVIGHNGKAYKLDKNSNGTYRWKLCRGRYSKKKDGTVEYKNAKRPLSDEQYYRPKCESYPTIERLDKKEEEKRILDNKYNHNCQIFFSNFERYVLDPVPDQRIEVKKIWDSLELENKNVCMKKLTSDNKILDFINLIETLL